MKSMIWLLGTAAVISASTALAGDGSIRNSPHFIQTAAVTRADMNGLIGHSVETAQGERIGTVNGVYATKDGKISTVIVGIGAPLGASDRNVALSWKQLHFTEDGKKVVVNMSKEQVKDLPTYTMPATSRGSVLAEAPLKTMPPAPADKTMKDRYEDAKDTVKDKMEAAKDKVADMTTDKDDKMPTTTSHGMEVGKLIGTNVETVTGDRIGEIDAVYLDKSGRVDSVIVGVGGFLGVGEHDVALKWGKLDIAPDGSKVIINTTKDELKTMQAYHYPQPDYRGAIFGYYGP